VKVCVRLSKDTFTDTTVYSGVQSTPEYSYDERHNKIKMVCTSDRNITYCSFLAYSGEEKRNVTVGFVDNLCKSQ
jgi:hypothetical protein